MRSNIYLAWRYVCHHRWSTFWLVGCISLSLYLPISSRLLLQDFQAEIEQRAANTPFVVGATGSRFELAIHALHFTGTPPQTLEYGQLTELRREGNANVIPIHARFKTRAFPDRQEGYPIVGTSLDYFSQRRLECGSGRLFGRLGECVIGHELAQREQVKCGDTVLSQAGNAFDLVGGQPIRMQVVGVLKRTYSDDDSACFVDVKTAWVIEGLGHGHEDLRDVHEDRLLGNDNGTLVANDALDRYLEITDENVGTFHFHGDPDTFPVTAAIAFPESDKAALLFEGQFLESDVSAMVIRPPLVMNELSERIFRAQRFFDGVLLILLFVTALFVALITLLSRKLRQNEMKTMFKIGCRRMKIVWLQATELSIVFAISLLIAGVGSAVTAALSDTLVRQLVFT